MILWNFCSAFGWLVGWPGADCCRFLVRASGCMVGILKCQALVLVFYLIRMQSLHAMLWYLRCTYLSFKKVNYVVDNWILALRCMEWMLYLCHGWSMRLSICFTSNCVSGYLQLRDPLQLVVKFSAQLFLALNSHWLDENNIFLVTCLNWIWNFWVFFFSSFLVSGVLVLVINNIRVKDLLLVWFMIKLICKYK